ncbi:hypothetical protein PISMIDRAFT_420841 [Pisolithus microcarpus 441]|uniref:Uncharacterized protein n=1 Tax=Pisolithus microcarpus 441 TaxID=765257 RepID=A0A0C9ZDN3_9AGAM|nr:hypothetical protein PISMIDRAFT_420841 [Pisolithus microcarpus 441]
MHNHHCGSMHYPCFFSEPDTGTQKSYANRRMTNCKAISTPGEWRAASTLELNLVCGVRVGRDG